MLKKYFSSIIDKVRNISLFTSSKKNEVSKENVEEKCYCGVNIDITKRKKIPLKKQMKLLYENIDTDLKNKAFFKSKVLFFLSKETTDVNSHYRFCRYIYAIKDYSKPGNNEEIQLCPYLNSFHCPDNRDVIKFEKFIEKFLRDLKRVDMIIDVNQDSLLFLNILHFIIFFKNNYKIDTQEAQKLFSIYKEIKNIIMANSNISCYSYVNIKNEFSCFDLRVIEEYYYIAKYGIDIEIDTDVKYNADNLEDNIKQLIYIFNDRYLSDGAESNSIRYAAKHILKRR